MTEQTLQARLEDIVAPLRQERNEIRERRTALQQEAHSLQLQETKLGVAIRAILRAAGVEDTEETHTYTVKKQSHKQSHKRSLKGVGPERLAVLLDEMRKAGPAGTTAVELREKLQYADPVVYTGLNMLRDDGQIRLAGTVISQDTGSRRKRYVYVGGDNGE